MGIGKVKNTNISSRMSFALFSFVFVFIDKILQKWRLSGESEFTTEKRQLFILQYMGFSTRAEIFYPCSRNFLENRAETRHVIGPLKR